MSDSKTPSASALQSRGLDVIAAAKYVGVPPSTFRKLARLDIAPQPLNIPEVNRNVYDREAIDRAMSAVAK